MNFYADTSIVIWTAVTVVSVYLLPAVFSALWPATHTLNAKLWNLKVNLLRPSRRSAEVPKSSSLKPKLSTTQNRYCKDVDDWHRVFGVS